MSGIFFYKKRTALATRGVELIYHTLGAKRKGRERKRRKKEKGTKEEIQACSERYDLKSPCRKSRALICESVREDITDIRKESKPEESHPLTGGFADPDRSAAASQFVRTKSGARVPLKFLLVIHTGAR